MLKTNIIATFLYLFYSIFFFESCIECPIFAGFTFIGLFSIFSSLIFLFIISFVNNEKNKLKKLFNIVFQPFLAIICIIIGYNSIDLINNINLKRKYDAMFKFRKMVWDGKIICENNICGVPDELKSKLGKNVAKNGTDYIFFKFPIGGFNAFVIANDYNYVYEKYSYFNTTCSDYVYIVSHDRKRSQKR